MPSFLLGKIFSSYDKSTKACFNANGRCGLRGRCFYCPQRAQRPFVSRRCYLKMKSSKIWKFEDRQFIQKGRSKPYTWYFQDIGSTNLCMHFQLHSNPWNCDCHLKNFRDWVVYRGLYTYPTSCAEPERLADKLWQDVDPKDFACKPDIRVPQSVVFSQPGANVTLSCFIIGNPMPDAKWVLKVT